MYDYWMFGGLVITGDGKTDRIWHTEVGAPPRKKFDFMHVKVFKKYILLTSYNIICLEKWFLDDKTVVLKNLKILSSRKC